MRQGAPSSWNLSALNRGCRGMGLERAPAPSIRRNLARAEMLEGWEARGTRIQPSRITLNALPRAILGPDPRKEPVLCPFRGATC